MLGSKQFKKLFLCLGYLILLLIMDKMFAFSQSPVGYWKTIDDETQKPKSIIKIFESHNHTLIGQIVRLFPKTNENPNHKLCKACKGLLHNKPIVGMIILTGLQYDSNQWIGGKIMDPANGKTYNCTIRLASDGKELYVRGYIGITLFGRSQTWNRVDLMAN